jgi:hypothetical protein
MISFHPGMRLRILYPVVRQRKVRKIGYISSEIICQNKTILDAPPIPKNGDPVVFCIAV